MAKKLLMPVFIWNEEFLAIKTNVNLCFIPRDPPFHATSEKPQVERLLHLAATRLPTYCPTTTILHHQRQLKITTEAGC